MNTSTPTPNTSPAPHVALIGLGYVGLPTALALLSAGATVTGFDISENRIAAILAQDVELIPEDHERLARALAETPSRLHLTSDPADLTAADAVIIAVPTPIGSDFTPDLGPVKAATAMVIKHARPGQTFILTSTTYVGCSHDLLSVPLTEAGFTVGKDVHVAFSPERIDPGNTVHTQATVTRVLGAATPACLDAARAIIELCAPRTHDVSSLEAAEMAKLIENTFRAVNIAWINEMADAARNLGLDISEVIDAAATKPYGFTKFTPGPGIGGHCIPLDPHYLLSGLPAGSAPLTELTMQKVHARPTQVVARIDELLDRSGKSLSGAHVLIAGVAYKPNIEDVRESPALDIIDLLLAAGAHVHFHDPHVKQIRINSDLTLFNEDLASISDMDLILWHTPHADMPAEQVLADAKLVLDSSYRLDRTDERFHLL